MSLELQIERLWIFFKHQKQGKKHEEEENDICEILSQIFWRKNLKPLYFQTPYLYHF